MGDRHVTIVSAVKDRAARHAGLGRSRCDLIDGVQTREVRNIVTANGITTEVHREDWAIVGAVEQVIHVSLRGPVPSARGTCTSARPIT